MFQFRTMGRNSPILGEAREIGLMIALEILEDKKTRKSATDLTKQLRRSVLQREVMIEADGHHSNVARHLPPLVITEEHLIKERG